ncbi:hypothetical protein MPSEU_000563300 [Mayamaea pseudoterrestris]|nr:hypothetical protein MPSEU_000563300 [Mayamaea pseudoterrestris]
MSGRRRVIPEEEYKQMLGSIIREQYFPDIPQLESQLALWERRSHGDAVGAVGVRRAARQLQEHRLTLKDIEQEQETDTDERGLRKLPRPLHQESVTGFHERVVSEDNAEFERVQSQEKCLTDIQRKKDYLLSMDTKSSTEQHEPRHPLVDSPLPLASDLFEPQFTATHFADQKPETVENSLFFVPVLQKQSHLDDDVAISHLLMPPPINRSGSIAEKEKASLVEYIPKTRVGKMIDPGATRFRPPVKTTGQIMTMFCHDAHLEGSATDNNDGASCYASSTDASTDLDATPTKTLAVDMRRAKRKRAHELETYVNMTPLVKPNASPIVTWGRVGATPMVLRPSGAGEDAASITFSVPNASARDLAADRALASLEERTRKARASTQNRMPAKSTTMTARLGRVGHSASARSAHSLGTALRASNNLASALSGRLNASTARDHALKATPRMAIETTKEEGLLLTKGKLSITDGLLHLPT